MLPNMCRNIIICYIIANIDIKMLFCDFSGLLSVFMCQFILAIIFLFIKKELRHHVTVFMQSALVGSLYPVSFPAL